MLRYYEQVGLIEPQRTPAGYRVYDDRSLLRLTFISRAKALGLSLEEIAEVADLWDGDRVGPCRTGSVRCWPTRSRACDHQARDAEALGRQLRHVAAGLEGLPPRRALRRGLRLSGH